MTAKLRLDVAHDYEFILIGISCHEKDYRLCWSLNNLLGLDLKKSADLEIREKKQDVSQGFPFYEFEQEYSQFYLIGNRNQESILIPEQKQADFFLMIKGTLPDGEKEKILAGIKKTERVLTAFEINTESLRSRQNLLF